VFCALSLLAGCRNAEQEAVRQLAASGIPAQRNAAGQVCRVDATDAALPDGFWTALAEFPDLETLILTSVDLTEDNLTGLDCFDHLKFLDLSYSQVGPVAIGHLVRLNSLRHLSLNGVSLSPDELRRLSQMHQLRTLALVQTNLNDQQIEDLEHALPGCLIAH